MTDTIDKETNERTDGRMDGRTETFVRPFVCLVLRWSLRFSVCDESSAVEAYAATEAL